ncbi:SDR family NAD(P)-dependent oxidoreductase [soil metagenome]
MTDTSFADKTAIITGGGSGIGAATAHELARQGASVVIADISLDSAKTTAESITAEGGKASAFQMDVSISSQSADAVDFAVNTYGGLHYAVNNVAIGNSGTPIGEFDLDDWRHQMAVCLDGVLYGLRYEIPAILNAGGGAIVNISSIAGIWGTYTNAAYVTAKHAIIGLTKAAALEYANQGIRVNAVGPGYVETPLVVQNIPAERRAQLGKRHPIGRMGQPQELANLITFLLSDKASFMTGGMYVADGGFTAGYKGSNTSVADASE